MRVSNVPIDMASEQKNIQGILSTRQAIYLGVGGVILYSYIPILFNIFIGFLGWYGAGLLCLFFSLPVLIVVALVGFIKSRKVGVYYDVYLMIMISRKSQYGIWRKGD